MTGTKVASNFDTDGPLVAIGIGMGRTGSYSLKQALELLLKQPCYHSQEIIQNHRKHIALWRDILEQLQLNPNAEISVQNIRRIFKGFRAATGHPVYALHRQLLSIYPEAKFILTTRDSRSWIDSVRATIRPHVPRFPPTTFGRLKEKLDLGSGFFQTYTLSFRLALGWDVNIDDDEECVRAFEARIQRIVRTIPPERLLVFHVKDGWEPLCRFLQLPVPNIPFPRTHTREDMFRIYDRRRRRNKRLVAASVLLLVSVVGLVAVLLARILF